ncbi:hypothetical protein HN51_034151 [Arachis hypogaea]
MLLSQAIATGIAVFWLLSHSSFSMRPLRLGTQMVHTVLCTTPHATPPYYNKETLHSTQHIHNMDHDMGMAAPPPSTMVMMKRRHFMHTTFFWGTKSEVLFD